VRHCLSDVPHLNPGSRRKYRMHAPTLVAGTTAIGRVPSISEGECLSAALARCHSVAEQISDAPMYLRRGVGLSDVRNLHFRRKLRLGGEGIWIGWVHVGCATFRFANCFRLRPLPLVRGVRLGYWRTHPRLAHLPMDDPTLAVGWARCPPPKMGWPANGYRVCAFHSRLGRV